MKKTLFLAVMAGAALAGCVKNEPIANSDGSPGRITFDAPVVSVPTRATEIYGNYPGDKDFAVYALYHVGTYNENSASSMYMTNVRCIADNEATPTTWNPVTDYYWPKNGYLTFAAYAPVMAAVPAEDLGTAVGVKWDDTGFTFQNFTVNDDPTQQIDLLYSDRQYNKRSTSVVTGKPYDGVTIPFKHALSSIVFKAKTDGNYPEGTIKLTNIEVTNVVKKGTFKQNLTADIAGDTDEIVPAWDIDATIADNVKDRYTVFASVNGLPLIITEAFVNGKVDEPGDSYDETNNPPADPNAINDGVRRSDLIVIPQSLDRDGDDNDVFVYISYTIQNGNETAVPQTHQFKLSVENQGAGLANAWEMGKRYIYHITIGLDKIYFNPQVTNWEEVTGEVIQIN